MLISSHIAAAQAMLGHDVHIMTYRSRDEGASPNCRREQAKMASIA